MTRTMSELELVGLRKSFLARPDGTTRPQERVAIAESYPNLEGVIRGVIRRFHYPPEVLDDLTQEVWAKVFAGLTRVRLDPGLGSVTGWVVKIAKDEATSHARQLAKRRQVPLPPDIADTLADPEPGPDIEFDQTHNETELRSLIEEFAAGLPDELEQRVVRLYQLQECSLSRIMEVMGISKARAWGILRRLRPKLADCLRRNGYDSGREKPENYFDFSNH